MYTISHISINNISSSFSFLNPLNCSGYNLLSNNWIFYSAKMGREIDKSQALRPYLTTWLVKLIIAIYVVQHKVL
jgi:hypothetical protein